MADRPRRVQAGDPISAGGYNDLVDASNTIFSAGGLAGVSVKVTSGGLTLSTRDQHHRVTLPSTIVPVKNVDDTYDLNAWDTVQLKWPERADGPAYQKRKNYYGSPYVEVCRPKESAFGRWGIAANYMAKDGGTGWAMIGGIMIGRAQNSTTYNSSYTGTESLDRVDTWRDTRFLQWTSAGAGEVLWISQTDLEIVDNPNVYDIIFRMGDRKTNPIGFQGWYDDVGVAEVIQFNDKVTVTEIEPGIVLLDGQM